MLSQYYPQPYPHPFRYELNKDMNFSAAHFIPHKSAGNCQRTHGHTYFVNITIGGNSLDEAGFLTDFKMLKKLVHDRFDHTLLNDQETYEEQWSINPYAMPSTEVMARAIWIITQGYLGTLPNSPFCLQVILRETPTSYVIFRPQPGIDFSIEQPPTEEPNYVIGD